MTLSVTRTPLLNTARADYTMPVSVQSFWVIACGNSETQDNSGTITRPLTHITDTEKKLVTIPYGTSIAVCHRYTDGATVSTSPVINVFGRTVISGAEDSDVVPTPADETDFGPVGEFMRLVNKAGNVDITLSDSATDLDDGTFEYTTVDPDAHVIDTMGCNQIIIAIKTAAAYGVGGNVGDIILKAI